MRGLKFPAYGLTTVGILNILFGLYFLFNAVIVFYMGVDYRNFNSEEEKFYFNIGLYGVMALGIVSLLLAPVIIYGASRMMRGVVDGKARLAAILAMIPVTSFPAFLIGFPIGIWALIALAKAKKNA